MPGFQLNANAFDTNARDWGDPTGPSTSLGHQQESILRELGYWTRALPPDVQAAYRDTWLRIHRDEHQAIRVDAQARHDGHRTGVEVLFRLLGDMHRDDGGGMRAPSSRVVRAALDILDAAGKDPLVREQCYLFAMAGASDCHTNSTAQFEKIRDALKFIAARNVGDFMRLARESAASDLVDRFLADRLRGTGVEREALEVSTYLKHELASRSLIRQPRLPLPDIAEGHSHFAQHQLRAARIDESRLKDDIVGYVAQHLNEAVVRTLNEAPAWRKLLKQDYRQQIDQCVEGIQDQMQTLFEAENLEDASKNARALGFRHLAKTAKDGALKLATQAIVNAYKAGSPGQLESRAERLDKSRIGGAIADALNPYSREMERTASRWTSETGALVREGWGRLPEGASGNHGADANPMRTRLFEKYGLRLDFLQKNVAGFATLRPEQWERHARAIKEAIDEVKSRIPGASPAAYDFRCSPGGTLGYSARLRMDAPREQRLLADRAVAIPPARPVAERLVAERPARNAMPVSRPQVESPQESQQQSQQQSRQEMPRPGITAILADPVSYIHFDSPEDSDSSDTDTSESALRLEAEFIEIQRAIEAMVEGGMRNLTPGTPHLSATGEEARQADGQAQEARRPLAGTQRPSVNVPPMPDRQAADPAGSITRQLAASSDPELQRAIQASLQDAAASRQASHAGSPPVRAAQAAPSTESVTRRLEASEDSELQRAIQASLEEHASSRARQRQPVDGGAGTGGRPHAAAHATDSRRAVESSAHVPGVPDDVDLQRAIEASLAASSPRTTAPQSLPQQRQFIDLEALRRAVEQTNPRQSRPAATAVPSGRPADARPSPGAVLSPPVALESSPAASRDASIRESLATLGFQEGGLPSYSVPPTLSQSRARDLHLRLNAMLSSPDVSSQVARLLRRDYLVGLSECTQLSDPRQAALGAQLAASHLDALRIAIRSGQLNSADALAALSPPQAGRNSHLFDLASTISGVARTEQQASAYNRLGHSLAMFLRRAVLGTPTNDPHGSAAPAGQYPPQVQEALTRSYPHESGRASIIELLSRDNESRARQLVNFTLRRLGLVPPEMGMATLRPEQERAASEAGRSLGAAVDTLEQLVDRVARLLIEEAAQVREERAGRVEAPPLRRGGADDRDGGAGGAGGGGPGVAGGPRGPGASAGGAGSTGGGQGGAGQARGAGGVSGNRMASDATADPLPQLSALSDTVQRLMQGAGGHMQRPSEQELRDLLEGGASFNDIRHHAQRVEARTAHLELLGSLVRTGVLPPRQTFEQLLPHLQSATLADIKTLGLKYPTSSASEERHRLVAATANLVGDIVRAQPERKAEVEKALKKSAFFRYRDTGEHGKAVKNALRAQFNGPPAAPAGAASVAQAAQRMVALARRASETAQFDLKSLETWRLEKASQAAAQPAPEPVQPASVQRAKVAQPSLGLGWILNQAVGPEALVQARLNQAFQEERQSRSDAETRRLKADIAASHRHTTSPWDASVQSGPRIENLFLRKEKAKAGGASRVPVEEAARDASPESQRGFSRSSSIASISSFASISSISSSASSSYASSSYAGSSYARSSYARSSYAESTYAESSYAGSSYGESSYAGSERDWSPVRSSHVRRPSIDSTETFDGAVVQKVLSETMANASIMRTDGLYRLSEPPKDGETMDKLLGL